MNLTTLEQSKNLKEWGAPQDTSHYWFDVLSDDGKEKGHYILREADWKYDAGEFGGDKAIAAYDLESLIAWLGDDMYSLLKRGKDGVVEGDSITVGSGTYWEANNGYGWKSGRADMPLEAVYALARSIHQPNN